VIIYKCAAKLIITAGTDVGMSDLSIYIGAASFIRGLRMLNTIRLASDIRPVLSRPTRVL